jgi:hypothetical protein
MGINNTLLITQTKIIEAMVFIKYPNEGYFFLSRLWYGYVIPFHILIDMVSSPKDS